MIRRETCPRCKGNRYVSQPTPPTPGQPKHTKCPECGGQGYKITVAR